MSAQALISQLEGLRRRWLEMPTADGLQQPTEGPVRLQIDTPSQYAAVRIYEAMRTSDGDKLITLVSPLVKEWERITWAFVLGAGVGGGDAAKCDARLVALLLADRPEWVNQLAIEALEQAKRARERVTAASGN